MKTVYKCYEDYKYYKTRDTGDREYSYFKEKGVVTEAIDMNDMSYRKTAVVNAEGKIITKKEWDRALRKVIKHMEESMTA